MLEALWLIPVLPLASFGVLAAFGGRMPAKTAGWIGVGSVGLAAAAAFAVDAAYLAAPPEGGVFVQTLWTWMSVGGLDVGITFYLDPLCLVMIFVVTFVGFLIHVYSIGYMAGEEGIARFFAYMNLFVGFMLVLVMADNLLLLLLGWEGVGLCSYLLIGFWYRVPANGLAARKAFVVTRVGDTALTVGMFLLFLHLGTLNIQALMERAAHAWPAGSALATAAALLILGGAVGKSAQLPLQTWLPDAMAGPTPVSALIHAATMVTGGVYLIARTHVLFELAPPAMAVTAWVGTGTLLLSGFAALAQRDIKRVLAYSTISQIGYMFLALGVGAWSAAVFHLMTHAFFKALLFMGAGAIIISLHHEQDIFRMGGLRRSMPVVFWTFLAAAASLAAVPFVTAGFFSKDLILWRAFSSERGGTVLWALGYGGAFLTSLYAFRLVFLVFYGKERAKPHRGLGASILVPCVILGVLSLAGGFVQTPEPLGHVSLFGRFLEGTFAPGGAAEEILAHAANPGTEGLLLALGGGIGILGILVALLFYLWRPGLSERLARVRVSRGLSRWWFSGFGFDALYDLLFVRPFLAAARAVRRELFDWIYTFLALIASGTHHALSASENGRLRFYAWGIALGAVGAAALALLL